VSPKRQRISLYFQCHPHNISHDEVCSFLEHLLRHLRGHVIVLWDNASIHKGDRIREMCRRFPRLHLEALPSYTPQLNPDEEVWAYAKAKLANGRPDDLKELLDRLTRFGAHSGACGVRNAVSAGACSTQSYPLFFTSYCVIYVEINKRLLFSRPRAAIPDPPAVCASDSTFASLCGAAFELCTQHLSRFTLVCAAGSASGKGFAFAT
jgi:transposase